MCRLGRRWLLLGRKVATSCCPSPKVDPFQAVKADKHDTAVKSVYKTALCLRAQLNE